MSRLIPNGITRGDVLQAIRDFEAGAPHTFGPSLYYDLLHDGQRYPPKAIVGLAARRLAGRTLRPEDFSGGERSKCFRTLERAGFTIVQKREADLHTTRRPASPFPEEVEPDTFTEGTVRTVTVNRYERDEDARAACIAHYGARCQVCTLDFSARYGAIGEGFIHVHHLVPLSEIRAAYRVDPVRDLRPVCPNCHAMLHRRRPEPYTIEELRAMLIPGQ